MNKNRIEYMLEQRDLAKSFSEIKVDIDDELFRLLEKQAKLKEVSVEELFYCIILDQMLQLKKNEISPKNDEKVIDIYDFWNLEEYIETNEKYIVATHNNPIVIIPIKEYDKNKVNSLL